MDFWFDLEGLDGTRDADGVIDTFSPVGVHSYAPDHPLAAALAGRKVGDVFMMPAGFGTDRRYRIRQLKHKYIWLLHDIMATHAARFPETTSLVEVTMKDGNVQPVLDVVRDSQSKDDFVTNTYGDFPVPLAAVAAMSHWHVLALAEHLSSIGKNLRTCLGGLEEREEAIGFIRGARGKGVVFDTLTVWQLQELGHLAAAKRYFGRLCIARSTFDEILEVRAKIESNRGREFMTIHYAGEQAWRHDHTLDETEARLTMVSGVIEDIEVHCETLPVDGSDDTRLEQIVGVYAARKILDPVYIAKSQGIIIVSEDLNLRQLAAQHKVIGGAWLQVLLHVLSADDVISKQDYLISVGMLGAMRHDHVWVDAKILIGILTLDDPRAFALYEAAIRFMGGRKAEMRSHLVVTLGLMRTIWAAGLPAWEQGRAVGKLLEQMTRSRPYDWKAVLHLIDEELGRCIAHGDTLARQGRNYLRDWITGHFYNLEEIRSFDKDVAEVRTTRPLKAAKKRKAKRVGRG